VLVRKRLERNKSKLMSMLQEKPKAMKKWKAKNKLLQRKSLKNKNKAVRNKETRTITRNYKHQYLQIKRLLLNLKKTDLQETKKVGLMMRDTMFHKKDQISMKLKNTIITSEVIQAIIFMRRC
jgi:hypothetical protein